MTTSERIIRALRERALTLATAESCTGGMAGASLTAVPGSSAAYLGGVISYTNAVKADILGVPRETLEGYGAVSGQTAAAMAQGVQTRLGASVGASVTGLAGPTGDGSGKPVGLVYTAVCCGGQTRCREHRFSGSREDVRIAARDALLAQILQCITEK